MDPKKKAGRYARILRQLQDLLYKSPDLDSKLATIAAILHNKMDYFFWTGFYFLKDGDLVVKSYQGPVACQVLERNKGVCWAGVNQQKTIVVPDVHQFPGHIACDSRSKSEIVVPVRDSGGKVTGVLDIDSKFLNSFDDTDAAYLEKILGLINR